MPQRTSAGLYLDVPAHGPATNGVTAARSSADPGVGFSAVRRWRQGARAGAVGWPSGPKGDRGGFGRHPGRVSVPWWRLGIARRRSGDAPACADHDAPGPWPIPGCSRCGPGWLRSALHRRRWPRPALRACSMNGASLRRNAAAFLVLRSISNSAPSTPNRTVSAAGPHQDHLRVRRLSAVPSRPPGCAGLSAPRSTVMAAGARGAANHLNGCTRPADRDQLSSAPGVPIANENRLVVADAFGTPSRSKRSPPGACSLAHRRRAVLADGVMTPRTGLPGAGSWWACSGAAMTRRTPLEARMVQPPDPSAQAVAGSSSRPLLSRTSGRRPLRL